MPLRGKQWSYCFVSSNAIPVAPSKAARLGRRRSEGLAEGPQEACGVPTHCNALVGMACGKHGGLGREHEPRIVTQQAGCVDEASTGRRLDQ